MPRYPQSGGSVTATAPITGTGTVADPLAMAAATNSVNGYMTSTKSTALATAQTDITALQTSVAAIPAISQVLIPNDGATYSTNGVVTVNLPTGWTPTTGKMYRLRAVVSILYLGGESASIELQGHVSRIGGTVVLGTPQVAGAISYTNADAALAVAVFNLSGGAVRIGCTGVAARTLTWGAIFQYQEMTQA